MRQNYKVAIDLDDVIWDLNTPWLSWYRDITGDTVQPEDIKSWDIGKYINKGNPDMLFHILTIPEFWLKVNPYPNTDEILRSMNERYYLYIITATNYKVCVPKFNRLFSLFPWLESRQLIICNDKLALNESFNSVIDDNPNNIMASDHGFLANSNDILITKPYNDDIKKLYNYAYDLKEAYAMLRMKWGN